MTIMDRRRQRRWGWRFWLISHRSICCGGLHPCVVASTAGHTTPHSGAASLCASSSSLPPGQHHRSSISSLLFHFPTPICDLHRSQPPHVLLLRHQRPSRSGGAALRPCDVARTSCSACYFRPLQTPPSSACTPTSTSSHPRSPHSPVSPPPPAQPPLHLHLHLHLQFHLHHLLHLRTTPACFRCSTSQRPPCHHQRQHLPQH